MILSFSEALKYLGDDVFSEQVNMLAEQNFNQWYETYYKTHPADYPDPYRIYNNFMLVANGFAGNSVLEGFMYIDDSNGKKVIAGTITLNIDDLAVNKGAQNICINNVYVIPEYRNKGIAKQLIKYMMNHVKNNRPMLDKINLFCEEHLIDFYKSLGWKLFSNTPTLTYWYEMIWDLNNKLNKSVALGL